MPIDFFHEWLFRSFFVPVLAQPLLVHMVRCSYEQVNAILSVDHFSQIRLLEAILSFCYFKHFLWFSCPFLNLCIEYGTGVFLVAFSKIGCCLFLFSVDFRYFIFFRSSGFVVIYSLVFIQLLIQKYSMRY